MTFLKLLKESVIPLILLYINLLVIIIALAQPNWKNYITAFWALYNSTWLSSAMYSLAKDILSTEGANAKKSQIHNNYRL